VGNRAKTTTRPGIDLNAPDVIRNPFPTYTLMCTQFPVCQLEPNGIWAISQMDDVRFALKNHAAFSSEGMKALCKPAWLEGTFLDQSILTQDPPGHDRQRALINKAFVKRVINLLIPKLHETATSLIDRFDFDQEFDFSHRFSWPYIEKIVGRMIGTDELQDVSELKYFIELQDTITPERPLPSVANEIETAFKIQYGFFREAIASRRQKPRDDIISAVLAAEIDGKKLPEQATIAFLHLLTSAALHTTAHALNNAIVQLARDPQLIPVLRESPDKINAFIEELLRFSPPTHSLFRQTTQDITIRGVTIPRGELVMLMLAAANRDPAHFKEPDRFDISRENSKAHVSFGDGAHTCVGSALAKVEIRIALEALLAKISHVSCRSEEDIDWLVSMVSRGISNLPVRLSRR
jgi:cytochrome P450